MAEPASTSPPLPASERPRRPLPHRLRLLFVGPDEPPWALLALRLESAGCAQAQFDWERDVSAALGRLRKVTFDCTIVRAQPSSAEPPAALRFVEGLRASGSQDPVVVVMAGPDDQLSAQFEDLDCELLVTTAGWQSRALVAIVRRAVIRGDLRREMAGHEMTARRGRLRDRDEADNHLVQLRDVVARFRESMQAQSGTDGPRPSAETIAQINGFYHELLRTYVMMGSGSLADELRRLAELLSLAGVSTTEAMSMHLDQLESLLQGLGNRSSRHVMARADLLALELVIQLGELYRQQSRVRGIGDAGVDLMHAETLLQQTGQRSVPQERP